MSTTADGGIPDELAARRSMPAQVVLLYRNLGRSLALAWGLDRALVVQYLALGLVDALLPIAIAWVGKEIVDAVVAAAGRPDAAWTPALTWVGIEALLVIGRLMTGQAIGYTAEILRARMAAHIEGLVAEKASRLSVRHFEDPKFMDVMERARKDASWRPVEMITHGVSLSRQLITITGFAALLAGFSPWAVLALLLASLPFLAEARWSARQYEIRLARTQDERRAGYYQSALTSDSLVKEVKIFGLVRFFLDRWRAIQDRFLDEDRRFARSRGFWVTAMGAASSLVFYGVFAWIVVLAVRGELTLGAMVLYLGVFRQAQGAFQSAMSSVARAWSDSLYMGNLFRYLGIVDDDVARVGPGEDAEGDRETPPTIEIEGVSFGYPGSARSALSSVDLRIEAGEAVALVGANGAGKTTLIKLLTGLHRPTAGRILLDGRDVAEMDPGALRARIGVVFQDFAHYHLTAAENVGIGWVPGAGDRGAVSAAAARGGAAEILESLPEGYDTMLGRWFGGEQLSIGQWQRIAIARAFMRKSGVLVLDEPTASLDADAEHAIFDRFRQLAEGRTVILVTHRFSTVRMADRIVVLEGGAIAEIGTHRELIAKGGVYARMFGLQAAGYRLDGDDSSSAEPA
ncbi:MAG: ABC transporter ATP-binding protein/permease [Myxococcota bacterium]|nr:ABC transporter ATP-binding protein/permease [Myxococcota bacterium]